MRPISFDRYLLIFTVIAGIFLVYLAGGIATYYKYPPYQWIDDARTAYGALKQEQKMAKAIEKEERITKRKMEPIKVSKESFEGYTLITGIRRGVSAMVDMTGKIIYEWDEGHPRSINWRYARMLPDGDLLVVMEIRGRTPYGHGLLRLDKDSNEVWRTKIVMHHIVDVGPDGTIYGLSHRVVPTSKFPEIKFAKSQVLADSVVVLTSEGEVVHNIPVIEALINSPYRDIIAKKAANIAKKGDITHANAVQVLTPEMAKAFPMFKPGQILVSLRNLSLVGVLDVEKRSFVWAAQGSWRVQHDAEFVADGSIMMFDNQGAKGNNSRILKHYPATKKSETVFVGNQEHPFFSRVRGDQQQLPNGNILVNESMRGRVFEITPEGKIIWQFLNPFYSGNNRIYLSSALRYSKEELPPYLIGALNNKDGFKNKEAFKTKGRSNKEKPSMEPKKKPEEPGF